MASSDNPNSGNPALVITEEEFQRFCDFFYRRTGMIFGSGKRYYVDRRLLARIQATGSTDFQDYFIWLQSDRAEQEALINAFTINETYFYREEHQFKCLTASLLPEIVARKPRGQPIRIWSVPCSTGEEPYSLAIWLLENWAAVDDWNVEILAADIDTGVLQAAERAVYGERALMRLPRALVTRYFEMVGEREWRLSADIRGSVTYSRVNVVEAGEMARYRNMDVVFCRNMLIYFDDVSRREAAENFYDCLAPGGFICLGHTESMSRISPLFRVRRFADAIVYQKPVEVLRA